MLPVAEAAGIALPDRELACAPIHSECGARYLGAMRAAVNCALANRGFSATTRAALCIISFRARPCRSCSMSLTTLAKWKGMRDGQDKGVVCAPQGGDAGIRPRPFRAAGRPPSDRAARPGRRQHGDRFVCLGGCCRKRGKSVFVRLPWRGTGDVAPCRAEAMERSASWRPALCARHHYCSSSMRGVAEEAPGADKDVSAVVEVAEHAGLARRVARFRR